MFLCQPTGTSALLAQLPDFVPDHFINQLLPPHRGRGRPTLRTRPKRGAEKEALAARLRAESTMRVGWIAERLGMGALGLSEPPAVSPEKAWWGLAMIKN
jgi:hypothetical protein